jgi:uncharacterized protein YodC (DUF2158 family)
MADEIKPGDIVTLKSGSRPMTVQWTNEYDAGVVWEDKNGEHKQATYQLPALKKHV